MYLEHFQLTHSPFAEEAEGSNVQVFFPGARREEICLSLIVDILAGKQLIKLTGREGSGKTTLCRMVADQLPAEYEVVFLDNPMGAFVDLVRVLCIDLGMNPRDQAKDTPLDVLHCLLEKRKAEEIKVVLIIDEAEKLFLTTLEHLLRHIDKDQEAPGWITLLAGRLGLDANLGQLPAACTTIDIHTGYFLEDFTESETQQYLHFRLNEAGMCREQCENIFTEGAVAKIFATASGSLRLINILAEQTLQASCTEKSFMVLLDHVEPDALEPAPAFRLKSTIFEFYELLRSKRLLAGTMAGTVVAILLIGFMFMGNSGGDIPNPLTAPSVAGQAPQPSAEETKLPALAPSPSSKKWDGEKVYQEQLAASASWLTGMHSGKYTIQLMRLESGQAPVSIAKTLSQDDYYQIRKQLYIFRKKTNTPTIFVFHGLYDSLDAARKARNTMPIFLRTYHPYPLAVAEAMAKLTN